MLQLPVALTPELFRAFVDEVQKIAGNPAVDVGHYIDPEMLRTALPYAATAIGGALVYDQSNKAYNDWRTGRQMRMQQAMYGQ